MIGKCSMVKEKSYWQQTENYILKKKTKTIILMDKKRFLCIQGELFDVTGNMVLLKNILW